MSHSKLHSEEKQKDQNDLVNLTTAERVAVQDKAQDKLDKVKVTLYITPEVHRKLKILSAVTSVSMSAIVEQSLNSYLEREETEETNGYGHTYQLHKCPECAHPLVIRQGNLVAVSPTPTVIGEPILGSEEGLILR